MKFTNLSKFALLPLLAGVLVLVLSGCGASNNLALTQGNWSVTANSTGSAGTFYIGGNLAQTGTSLAGTMYVVGFSTCFSSSTTVVFSGAVKGKNVTLTSTSISGQVISVTATGASGSALSGTYTITGGCADGDTGNITANSVPSISATWSGPVVTKGGLNVTLAIAFKQAATASGDGTFALTGNLTFTNSTCSSTGTVNDAFIAGPYLVVNGLTNDGGNFSYTQVLLNNAASPSSMTGSYKVLGGNCDGDLDTPTFTKH